MAKESTTWGKLMLEAYQNHSVAIKQITRPTDCSGHYQWAWLKLGECIADDYQWAGFVIGILTMVVFIPVRHVTMLCLRRNFPERWNRILLSCLFLNVLSLLGGVLAMQLFQMILFDLMLTLMDCVMAVRMVTTAMSKALQRRDGYMEIGHQDSDTKDVNDRKPGLVSLCRISCFSGCLMLMSYTMTSSLSAETLSHRSLEATDFKEYNTSHSHYTHAVINLSGYLMGSVACFGHWALHFYLISLNGLQATDVTVVSERSFLKFGRYVLMSCDFFYIIGVLLHSKGWMVSMVTLPWVMQRLVHAGFQTVNICPSLWNCHDDYKSPGNRHDDEISTLMETDKGSDMGSRSESGDSDSSNILWDRNWKLPSFKDPFVYYEQNETSRRILDVARLKLVSGDVTTSADSDWSTTSVEQELEWEDETVTAMADLLNRQREASRQKIVALSLPPLTLTPAMAESRVERVRSWVSNSTPEEEKTPCLTVALDLDHNSNFFPDPLCEEEPIVTNFVTKRKYSL